LSQLTTVGACGYSPGQEAIFRQQDH